MGGVERGETPSRDCRRACYCTGSSTELLDAPATSTTTGRLPAASPVGTSTSTPYRPTNPGASPLKLTIAFVPPMVTVGVATVGCPLPGSPSAGGEDTAPRPVQ